MPGTRIFRYGHPALLPVRITVIQKERRGAAAADDVRINPGGVEPRRIGWFE